MQIGILKIALLLLCFAALTFEVWHLRSHVPSEQTQVTRAVPKHGPNFALLPTTEIAAYAALFGDPKPRMENWEPTVGDIDGLQTDLAQITALSSNEPNANWHIDDPRQYFSAVSSGRAERQKDHFL
jgi:hypothetical protein